jgi:hypothetical protein
MVSQAAAVDEPVTTLDETRAVIADCMDDIMKCFKPGMKITVLVRAVGYPDGSRDLLMTDDQLPFVVRAIETRMKSEAAT